MRETRKGNKRYQERQRRQKRNGGKRRGKDKSWTAETGESRLETVERIMENEENSLRLM